MIDLSDLGRIIILIIAGMCSGFMGGWFYGRKEAEATVRYFKHLLTIADGKIAVLERKKQRLAEYDPDLYTPNPDR